MKQNQSMYGTSRNDNRSYAHDALADKAAVGMRKIAQSAVAFYARMPF
jgi:hypothetical protein